MTLVIEDGSIVLNANSYVSTTELTAFATARGITITGDLEELLIQSMDFIEAQQFIGVKRSRDQSLVWPRYGVIIDGYYLDSTTIPQQLKDGQMQCAIAIDEGNDPLQDLQRTTKLEKVGDLEVMYSDSSTTMILNRKIMNALKKLLAGGGVMQVFRG